MEARGLLVGVALLIASGVACDSTDAAFIGVRTTGRGAGLEIVLDLCPGDHVERAEVLLYDPPVVGDEDDEPLWKIERSNEPKRPTPTEIVVGKEVNGCEEVGRSPRHFPSV